MKSAFLTSFAADVHRLNAAGYFPVRGGAEDDDIDALKVQVADLTKKVNEFRINNQTLIEKLEKFGDISPEDAADAAEIKKARERKELVDAKDIDAALDAQEKKLKEDYDRRLEAQDTKITDLSGSLRKLSVTNVLKSAAIEAGVRPEAVDDVVEGIEAQFETTDSGDLVRMVNGAAALSVANAGKNELPAEFFEGYAKSKPFFFNGSGGGGGDETHRKTPAGVRMITKAQFQTGEYAEGIKKKEIVVEGYEEPA